MVLGHDPDDCGGTDCTKSLPHCQKRMLLGERGFSRFGGLGLQKKFRRASGVMIGLGGKRKRHEVNA